MRVADLACYPELRFLDRYDVVVPALLAVALYALGEVCAKANVRSRVALCHSSRRI